MQERNETSYRLEQDNQVYILTTSLIADKLKLMVKDSQNEIYKGEFTINDLLKISRYFNNTKNVENVQKYLNGIIEKQRVGIFPEGYVVKIVLYLINNDKVYIPLTKNTINNTNYITDINNQYLQNKQSEITMPSTDYYTSQQIEENISPTTYNYQQNNTEYNLNSQNYYIDSNLNNNEGLDIYSIPGTSNINYNFTNKPIVANPIILDPIKPNEIISSSPNHKKVSSLQNFSSYPQTNDFGLNYNFQYNENQIGQTVNETDNIKNEYEKMKNEMKRMIENEEKAKLDMNLIKDENSSLANENKYLKNENENFKNQLINFQKELNLCKEENNAIKNKFKSFQNDATNYKSQNDELLSIKNEYENKIHLLQDSLEKSNKENELLKGEIEQLKHNLEAVTNKNDSLLNELNNLKNSTDEGPKSSINEEEVKRLIEENSVFRIKIQENESLKKQIEELQYQLQMEQMNKEHDDNEEDDEQQEVKGDIIHDMNELEMLTKKINKENKRIIINLLYKATADGDKASIFHEKCDQAQNTIVLVETKDGMRFGGYTTCNWSGNCIDKKDPDAFIFSFDKMKTYDNIPEDDAIGCYPKFGPIFLGCQIKIFDNFFVKGGTTYEKELNFNTEEDYELTNGKRSFEVKDIEVYEVIIE